MTQIDFGRIHFSVPGHFLCCIKFWDTDLKRVTFAANGYKKVLENNEVFLVVCGEVNEDQKVYLFENKEEKLYCIQLANPETQWIIDEYLDFIYIRDLQFEENKIKITLSKREA